MKEIADVAWDGDGRAPVIVQDAGTGAVLALDTLDRAALAETLATGRATYWVPADGTAGGCAAAGPLQMLTAAYLACDGRAILLQVQPAGPLCQEGGVTCFGETLTLTQPDGVRHGWAGSAADPLEIRWSREAAEGA